eukprot:TRINITY_DN3694_c0_g1_i8.p1 TRINITY_DN3694_c0_g1~~TRINITY_DN3694_c0_g1_i8.p1  ORF type:complete len:137 (-),score=8.10 TRINITY_DN3694_c0_g1_i8:171-581(-)
MKIDRGTHCSDHHSMIIDPSVLRETLRPHLGFLIEAANGSHTPRPHSFGKLDVIRRPRAHCLHPGDAFFNAYEPALLNVHQVKSLIEQPVYFVRVVPLELEMKLVRGRHHCMDLAVSVPWKEVAGCCVLAVMSCEA